MKIRERMKGFVIKMEHFLLGFGENRRKTEGKYELGLGLGLELELDGICTRLTIFILHSIHHFHTQFTTAYTMFTL